VGAQVRDQVRDQVGDFYSYSDNDLSWGSHWVGFYDFFKRLGIVDNKEFDRYEAYIKSGVFMTIFLQGFAIACPRPSSVKRDERHRLHSSDSPAIEWSNGEKYWFWHGTRVNEKIIMSSHQLTSEEIVGEKNSEVAKAIAEKIGWDQYMKQCGTILIHQWFDPTTSLHYELYDFRERRFELMPRLLKMESPELNDRTRPFYIESVDPGLKTCQAARRWQFQREDGTWPSVQEANENPSLEFICEL
jgi:hypothetical protein